SGFIIRLGGNSELPQADLCENISKEVIRVAPAENRTEQGRDIKSGSEHVAENCKNDKESDSELDGDETDLEENNLESDEDHNVDKENVSGDAVTADEQRMIGASSSLPPARFFLDFEGAKSWFRTYRRGRDSLRGREIGRRNRGRS
ncbi:hypothetical protein U1Q18_032081, partial [Sarracenia purpurea var. burkii]